jgi:hypothetical protein
MLAADVQAVPMEPFPLVMGGVQLTLTDLPGYVMQTQRWMAQTFATLVGELRTSLGALRRLIAGREEPAFQELLAKADEVLLHL